MKIVQTLYVDSEKDVLTDSFGWARPEFHLMSWALSCLQLKKIYGEVTLFANNNAREILIDVLQLPYSKIDTSLDDFVLPNKYLWALPKIFTYSKQKEPFLHIDGDVFIFDKFPKEFENADLATQNIELATEYYNSTQRELMANFDYFPSCVEKDFNTGVPIKAVNAGILGGNDVDFIKEYTDLAFEYINKNLYNMDKINVDRFNVFFEQHLFYVLAQEKQKTISFFIKEIFNDRGYKYLGNIYETPHRNYIHLLGHLKKDDFTCKQMAAKLRDLYPDYYYKIVSLFKKNNIPVFLPFYSYQSIDSKNDYSLLLTKSKAVYNGECQLQENNVRYDKELIDKKLKDIFLSFFDFNNSDIKEDYYLFVNTVFDFLKSNSKSADYYYGRDIVSLNWHNDIFHNENELLAKKIVQTEGVEIIDSQFDWGGG